MPKIKCDAKTCTYNSSKMCSKEAIAVSGARAKTSDETVCCTFDYLTKRNYNTEIATFDLDSIVWCDSLPCAYQEDGHCTSKEIAIKGEKAETHRDTLCKTFKPKDL